jgi:hypothetical protein
MASNLDLCLLLGMMSFVVSCVRAKGPFDVTPCARSPAAASGVRFTSIPVEL